MPNVTQYTDLDHLGRVAALRDVSVPAKTQAIAEQSARMDGYFRARYTLPFSVAGADVELACRALVTFQLLTDKGWNPLAGGGGDDAIAMAYKEAIRWLEGVRDGKIAPDVKDSSSAPEGEPSESAAMMSSPSRGWSTAGQDCDRGNQGAFVGGRRC